MEVESGYHNNNLHRMKMLQEYESTNKEETDKMLRAHCYTVVYVYINKTISYTVV